MKILAHCMAMHRNLTKKKTTTNQQIQTFETCVVGQFHADSSKNKTPFSKEFQEK